MICKLVLLRGFNRKTNAFFGLCVLSLVILCIYTHLLVFALRREELCRYKQAKLSQQ